MRFPSLSFGAALALAVVCTAGCSQTTSEGTSSGTSSAGTGGGGSDSGGSTSGGGTSGGTNGGGSTSGGVGGGATSGGSSGGTCGGVTCSKGLTCCGTGCTDVTSDTANCASCGHRCLLAQICQNSVCQKSPCFNGTNCNSTSACCGTNCCDSTEVCCVSNAGVSTWECADADAGCQPSCMPPNCPISSKRYKKDIVYLTEADRDRLHEDLLKLPLATFRYKTEGEATQPRLGFMVEDATSPSCIAPPGDRVDLYGYASMAVAAVQAQEQEIRELRAEVARLEVRLDGASKKPGPP